MKHVIALMAVVMFAGGLVRDQVDAWVADTVMPSFEIAQSVEVIDRDGDLLRAFTVAGGRWRLATSLHDVDPAYVAMLLRYEDKRFYHHAGVDPWAMLRGVGQAFWHGRVVSGGSTLTMQVARLLEDGSTGSWAGKLRQIRVALALERKLSKDEILTLYLNRAPFGGNIEGLRAASLAWFAKPPRRLTPAEAALLVALPQSPEARRPDRDAMAATAARDRVLERMELAVAIDAETYAGAIMIAVPATRHVLPAFAPHLTERVMAAAPAEQSHQLTLDRDLQQTLEGLAADAVAGRSDRVQVAIIVADHQTGEMLASVGSAAYRADGRAGFVDLTRALRSPGSTLKPFVYGLGFDQGMIHPETLIEDRPTDFGGYAPQNFDGLYRGELRVRRALQLSLNIPVVSVIEAMGPQHLIAAMQRAGTDPVVPGGKAGLAVALGGIGITLEDLVANYAALANAGVAVDLRSKTAPTSGFAAQHVMGPVAAWQVSDILLGVPRPRGVQGAGIAFKTGTSYGHRDAWAVGFDGRHVVGVWMGRADGTPVPGAFGGDLAAPVMFAAFARTKPEIEPIAAPPAATLILPTAQLPLPLQRFYSRLSIAEGPQIAFPPDGAELAMDRVTAKVREGTAPFTWLANGAPILTSHAREVDLGVLGAGYSALTVIDAAGLSARSEILLP